MTPIPTYTEGAVCTGPASWPDADFIVGNPPFLGSRKARASIGDNYIDAMHKSFAGLVASGADLCCYWLELSLRATSRSPQVRVGLLGTQGIRGGSSLHTLRRIKDNAHLFLAHSDREWVLDGAAVRISIVGFSGVRCDRVMLDGHPVNEISADLSTEHTATDAQPLSENASLSFQGTISSGPFQIDVATARTMLAKPNPHRMPNLDVLRPWLNGNALTKRQQGDWILISG